MDDDPEGAEPPVKILRLKKDDRDCLPSTSVIIHPIVHPSLFVEECPLAEFHIIRLNDKKDIGKVVKIVPELPEEFLHLKRVDSFGRIAIQLASEVISEEFLSKLGELGVDSTSLEILHVPLTKPRTRKQAEWARKFWPTAFHPHKETEDLLSGSYFSKEERIRVENWSQRARQIGCVVVQRGKILAEGSSSSRLLGHPAMKMIADLAQKNRQGSEYLATDCDVFLGTEPCAMCAMALVHSRAARVFFTRKAENGVLAEGTWQLHLVPSFNHHYKVFYVDLGFSDEDREVICR